MGGLRQFITTNGPGWDQLRMHSKLQYLEYELRLEIAEGRVRPDTISHVLKDFYLPALSSQLNNQRLIGPYQPQPDETHTLRCDVKTFRDDEMDAIDLRVVAYCSLCGQVYVWRSAIPMHLCHLDLTAFLNALSRLMEDAEAELSEMIERNDCVSVYRRAECAEWLINEVLKAPIECDRLDEAPFPRWLILSTALELGLQSADGTALSAPEALQSLAGYSRRQPLG